jgi:outer membrane protein
MALGVITSAAAQTLTEVYRRAQDQDMQYRAARLSLDAALEKLPQARAALLPTATLTAGNTRQSGDAVFTDGVTIQREPVSWNWSLQLTQPLFRAGNWLAYQQAGAQERMATVQMAQAEQDLLLRSAQAYFDVLLARESVGVLDAQLSAVKEQWVSAQRNFAVGTGTVTDVQEAQAKHAASLAQRVAAANELDSKLAELERMVGGVVEPPPVRLARTLPLASAEQLQAWRAAAGQDNLQVQLAAAALEVAEKEVGKNRSAHMPSLDLVASRSVNYSSTTLTSPSDLESRVNASQVGLQLSFPLFAGGGTQSKVREALAQQDKAAADLEGARRTAQSQTRQAISGVVNGLAQVQALEVAVQAGRGALEGNVIGFRVGTRVNPDVLNAQQQLYTAMRDLSKARVETAMQGLKLKAAAGALQVDDLVALESLMEPSTLETSK